MAQPKYIVKSLRMTNEVKQIFSDLEEYRDYCRFNMLKFNERDLYRSDQYRRFDKQRKRESRQESPQ